MTQKRKRQFGVWMDIHHAIIVGRADDRSNDFSVIGMAGDAGDVHVKPEKKMYPDASILQDRFFKEILFYMRNAEEVHVTGTGKWQEEFLKYMDNSPQCQDTVREVSISEKMSDDELAEFIQSKFN
jgi:hypothetical protein